MTADTRMANHSENGPGFSLLVPEGSRTEKIGILKNCDYCMDPLPHSPSSTSKVGAAAGF